VRSSGRPVSSELDATEPSFAEPRNPTMMPRAGGAFRSSCLRLDMGRLCSRDWNAITLM
jgi:hypothetical protein